MVVLVWEQGACVVKTGTMSQTISSHISGVAPWFLLTRRR